MDAKGKKFYINYLFSVAKQDSVAVIAKDGIDIAYKPDDNYAIAGSTEIYLQLKMTDINTNKGEYYDNCTDFKATGLPDNMGISSRGSLYVLDGDVAVKPGTYNIEISAVTPSGKAFSFTYNLKLVEGVTISGKVTDSFGEPIDGNYILFESPYDANAFRFSKSTYVDKYGNYSIRVIPGKYNIICDYNNSYKQVCNKNTEYNLKSNFYKVIFTSALHSSNESYITYNSIAAVNTATKYFRKVSSNLWRTSGSSSSRLELYAYLRKGATYRLKEQFSHTLNNGEWYKFVEKEFKCTGQRTVAVEYVKEED